MCHNVDLASAWIIAGCDVTTPNEPPTLATMRAIVVVKLPAPSPSP